MTEVYTLDLNFLGIPHVIASYLVKHSKGAVIVESGPGSTIAGLQAALKPHDLTVDDITAVLLTHIHLDHAGAAGWLARNGNHGQGADIYVHPNGAPHLLNPGKLLNSAARIYGEMMDTLWGEFLAVPEDRLMAAQDQQAIAIDGLRFCALDTSGHADHHFAYLFEDICFTGDVGGIRLPGPPHLRVPMPPPEFHLEKWRATVGRLQETGCKRVAPTHFGIYEDADHHWEMLKRGLGEVEQFMQAVLPSDPPLEAINDRFAAWTADRSKQQGLSEDEFAPYEAANPSWMSATGMQRYWRKYREGTRQPISQ
jgi:glyoxylase-like metal-dependent hydrolase (beta-lactamase superfamily II)